jgi:hypothetical protein
MDWVMQKCRTAFHRVEDAIFAFDASRLCRDRFACGYESRTSASD